MTLEIVRGAIRATQAEMEALIERTSICAFIREKKDFYTALFDADGVMAVGSNVPIFGDMTSPVFRHFPPDTMRPGDLYWYNDCYGSRGAVSHSNDQVLLAPVFHEGRRCAFVMSWAHFADIGGLRAGSISPDTTDIFQEGIIVPPTKLIDAGRTNEAALEIFHRNSRFPDQSRGDMRALMASVEVGVKRVEEIVARFGADVVEDALRQLLARTRRDRARAPRRDVCARRALASPTRSIPTATATGRSASGSRSPARPGRTAPTVSSSTRPRPTTRRSGRSNFLMNPGVPGMALGLFYLGGDPRQVCNAGGPQALDEVRLREGSLLWPRFPAPLGMRGLTMMRLLAALNGLVNAAGGKAPAAHSAYVITLMRGTWRTEAGALEPFLLADGIGVGYGARPFADGIDAVYFVAQENYPVEFLELGYPVRLRRYGIVQDSGGAGRYRGGCGIVREYEILAEEAVLAVRIDSVKNPPWGIAGGMSGGTGRAVVNPGTPQERVLAPLSDGNRLKRGDILLPRDRRRRRLRPSVRPSGRGGAGRRARRLRQPRSGREHYGVVVSGHAVDQPATAALRADPHSREGLPPQ